MREFRIGSRPIGAGYPTYIVAEISANHLGSLDRALDLVRAAHAAGADAVKLQTYTADTLTIDSAADYFRVEGTLWNGRTLYELYTEAHTPWEWHRPIRELARDLEFACFSTPFDATAVDFLATLDMPAYKIASFEIVDIPLLKRIAATGKPVIMSTGMATLEEIAEAVGAVRATATGGLALLKCTSAYPAPPSEVNLRTIGHLAETFAVPAGLSDHTLGIAVPVAAVAAGASIVEKHLTLARRDGGPDSAFSLEPDEFSAMVDAIRVAEQAMGRVRYGPSEAEKSSRLFRRSLFVVKDVKVGEVLSEEHVRSIRPGHGLHPRHLPDVLGRRAARDVVRGTPLSWDLVT